MLGIACVSLAQTHAIVELLVQNLNYFAFSSVVEAYSELVNS